MGPSARRRIQGTAGTADRGAQSLGSSLVHAVDADHARHVLGRAALRRGAAPRDGSKRWYGTGGNSFVAVVEFGPRVRALAVSAGGESGDPKSPHFNDQAERYATGNLRPVYFYPEELRGHTERTYRPGR